MRVVMSSLSFFVCFMLALWRVGAEAVGGGAVVLLNSARAKYPDFQHFIQPYLDHFGVPYPVLDISTNAPVTNLERYGLIVFGRCQIRTNHAYLSTASRDSL